MKAFEYVRPATIDEALAVLPSGRDPAERARVRVIAGGQDLLTEMKEHLAEPEVLVDLKRIAGLDRIEVGSDGSMSIGAMCTLAALEAHPHVQQHFPLLSQAAGSVGSAQIRSVGTLSGNLCQRPRCWYYRNEHVSCLKKGGAECLAYSGLSKYNAILGGGPSYIVHPSDLAPALVALGAEVTLQSSSQTRRLPLERFFTLPSEGPVAQENVLGPGELLVHVHVPALKADAGTWRSAYYKVRERGSYDFALAALALALAFDGDGATIKAARMCLGGVAPIPWRADKAESLLLGRKVDAGTCQAAGEAALKGAKALAHNAYKIELTRGLIERGLEQLAAG
jgi:xanthine dehydrogenase YagS FAD-binding subunit